MVVSAASIELKPSQPARAADACVNGVQESSSALARGPTTTPRRSEISACHKKKKKTKHRRLADSCRRAPTKLAVRADLPPCVSLESVFVESWSARHGGAEARARASRGAARQPGGSAPVGPSTAQFNNTRPGPPLSSRV